MPLPLLEPPLEGTGATKQGGTNPLFSEDHNAVNYNNEPAETSGDLPVGYNNLSSSSPLTNYAQFTFQDRKHDFWVYRGLHSGLPPLQVGTYNVTNNTFDPLPSATGIVN